MSTDRDKLSKEVIAKAQVIPVGVPCSCQIGSDLFMCNGHKLIATALAAERAATWEKAGVAVKLIAVLHAIAISGIGGSINDFWERLHSLPSDRQIRFCQALHQLCEAAGHNNVNRCELCESMGARNEDGYYTGDSFFDGTKATSVDSR
jgi:hypothetical protein